MPEIQAGIVLFGGHRTGALRFPTGLALLEFQITGDANRSRAPRRKAPH